MSESKQPTLPQILTRETVGRGRLFEIEQLHLRFSNGVERVYERLPATGPEAVMVVAINADDEILLIREYAAGFHAHMLTLPKGTLETGETLEQAANRELQEEAGVGARKLRWLKRLTLAPGHMGFTIHVMLATDLYPQRLPADEPEPIEVVPWPLQRLDELLHDNAFSEARAIAALVLARSALR